MYSRFENTMREELSKRNMSVNALSEAIGYDSKSIYNAFKNSVNGPGKAMLERIADYLDMACVYCRGIYSLAAIDGKELYSESVAV